VGRAPLGTDGFGLVPAPLDAIDPAFSTSASTVGSNYETRIKETKGKYVWRATLVSTRKKEQHEDK